MMKKSVITDRKPWLDNAKMFAMLIVVAGHVGPICGGWPFHLGGLFTAFNMPLFVFLSGYVSLSSLNNINSFNSLVIFLDKTFWRIVLPGVSLSAIDQAYIGLIFARKLWVIFALISVSLFFVKKIEQRVTKKTAFLIIRIILVLFLLVSSCWLNMYWFLTMLMKLQISIAVLLYFGKYIKMHNEIIVSCVFLWLGSFFLYSSWDFEMSLYFVLGIILRHVGIFDSLIKLDTWIMFVLFIIGIKLCYLITSDYSFYQYGFDDLATDGRLYIYVLRILTALFLICPIIHFVFSYSHSYNWFSKMGSYTLPFYTLHCLLLDDFISPYLHMRTIPYGWIYGVVIVCLMVVFCYALIRLFEHNCLLKAIILGR